MSFRQNRFAKYLVPQLLILGVVLFFSTATISADLDPPHDDSASLGCMTCHDMAAFDLPNLIPNPGHSPQNIDDTLYNTTVCWKCHDGSDPDIPYAETHSSFQTDNNYGTWTIQCVVCHNQHKQEQDHLFGTTYGMFIRRNINLAKILDNAPPSGATVAGKSGTKKVTFTGPATFTSNGPTIDGICQVCHTQTKYYKNDGTGAGHNPGANCSLCHGHTAGFKGSGHNETHFRWDGGCEGCHGAGAGAEIVVENIHGNDCDLCHTTGGPYDADTNKVGDNGFGDATLAEGDAGTWTASCITCHNQAQVPAFHGTTITEAVAVHNNLGSSRGAWADSGGTIPSTRAAGYTGKIDTANALIDDDYNCADCHDTERTSFSSLEALEVHVFESGRGSGNCLTCHGAAMVADEITSGISGTTIECEDCHSLANGNGPSGKKMYQYDGIRHHKTVNAQTGNCTRCHADPRPADLSAEPGHAGTAAVNDGTDTDGITWNDGFDDDFGINNPNPRPTQMGCRLCHTNYETYTVNVWAEIDSDWDTTELPDKHGYNKTPPAHGLTIYADNFDARGTTLTYFDQNDDLGNLNDAFKIRGMSQVTQSSIPSHRIYANDGSSKIEIYNYGACLSCHTVQIRHASPIPAADYDTPVYGTTTAARNTHPYDTLRYTPGRHVFNDFRGSGEPDPPSWENHTKNWGWMFGDDWDGRGRTVFWQTTWPEIYFDDVGNYSPNSLVTIPVNANVNKLEGFPATATYTIREFDSGPALPGIDDITITVAQWTGSAVYVEATNILGSAQDFSFTYTGAGGPCNTTMSWNTDHYEGICLAASGYTISDTVTVYNNTTAAPDEKTRALSDLTINPSTPVLSSILLTDNDANDPFPAESGYTNDVAGEVEVTIATTDYPTEMRLSESSTFNSDTDPWIPFESITTFTFSNTTNEEKTVYCQVKNNAGVSGTQSNTIILDTVDPTIQADTLTAPNGHVVGWQAEFWDVGTSQTITWNSGDITDVNLKANPIYFKESYDAGSTWQLLYIAQNEANDGSYTRTISGSPITSARIKVEARDKAGNAANDVSDNNYNKSTPYIVTNTSDALVAGSLRQVLTDLLAAGGNHSIWFNIPDTDPGIVDGVALISPATDLPTINQSDIYIEGGTQTALRGNTNTRGPEIRINKAGTSITGFTISGAVFSNIKDLQITGFTTGVSSSGSDTVLEGNHFGFSSGNTTGYTSVPNGTGALLSDDFPVIKQNFFGCFSTTGLDLTNSSDATADGNVFGLFPDPTDPTIPASPAVNCPVYGTNAILVRGSADGSDIANNIISGANTGIYLGGTSANTRITGNQIGTFYDSDDGWVTVSVGSASGVYLDTTGGNNVIGGTNVATADDTLNDSNVISPYNPDHWQPYRIGININNALDYSIGIYGNFIGTNPECDPVNDRAACEVFRGSVGIQIVHTLGVTIGGDVNTDPPCQAGNVIANMNGTGAGSYGIKLHNGTSNNREHRVHCNTFFDNGDGVLDDAYYQSSTPNPSRPVIVAADTTTVRVDNIWGGNGTTQEGDIVEVYLADFDGTEYGEGIKLVGLTQAEYGQTFVDVDISAAGLSAGDWLTATRTYHYTGTRYQTTPFSTNLRIPGSTTAPSLDWVGTGNYIGDGVHPNSAVFASSFTFQVKYTDTDGAFGDPPAIIEAWVDVNDSGVYDSTEKFAMTEVDPGDTDYTDGKLYETDVVLDFWSYMAGDGILNYRFYASDGSFYTVTGDPTYPLLDNTNTVTVTNTPSVLDWTGEPNYVSDGVDPDSGPQGSTFTFRVEYTDAENWGPNQIQVWVDTNDDGAYSAGEKFAMSVVDPGDTNYTDGRLFTSDVTLNLTGDGVYNYRFYASDIFSEDAIGTPAYPLLDETNTVEVTP